MCASSRVSLGFLLLDCWRSILLVRASTLPYSCPLLIVFARRHDQTGLYDGWALSPSRSPHLHRTRLPVSLFHAKLDSFADPTLLVYPVGPSRRTRQLFEIVFHVS